MKEALAAGLLSISGMAVRSFSCGSDCSIPESDPTQVDTKEVTKVPQFCGNAASCSQAGESAKGSPGPAASLQYAEARVSVK